MPAPVFRRRRLPHWDAPNSTFFITSCLANSIPATGRLDIAAFEERMARQPTPMQFSIHEWKARRESRLFIRHDDWLDLRPARRWLEDPRLAALISNAIRHFDGHRYDLLAYVVMPSHVHWVFRPRAEWFAREIRPDDQRSPREIILHSVQTFTAVAGNRLLRRSGVFWQRESYDRCVRDERELERVVAYIEHNPVKAGLVKRAEDWRFSSASTRV